MLITYSVLYSAENSNTYAIRAAVPIRYNCPELPPSFLLNETDGWNCNLCGSDMEFFQPYEPGDIIPFQTRFADNLNIPASVISYGFKTTLTALTTNFIEVELQDCCGETISSNIDDFSETYWVGHSTEVGSVQTWFINTGLFPTDLLCFRLKITYYKLNQITLLPEVERTIYTEYFKEVAECGDVGTVLIESTYQSVDCNNNYYGQLSNYLGTINTPFYNSLRLFGEVEFTGDTPSETENDRGTIIRTDLTNNYRVISGVYPPYYVKRLQQTVRGDVITVDGKQYKNFSYNPLGQDSRMFLIDLEFDSNCFIDNRKCNF